jgi:hypothetical protein
MTTITPLSWPSRSDGIGDEQWTQAKTLMAEPTNMGAAAVAKLLGVSRQGWNSIATQTGRPVDWVD